MFFLGRRWASKCLGPREILEQGWKVTFSSEQMGEDGSARKALAMQSWPREFGPETNGEVEDPLRGIVL